MTLNTRAVLTVLVFLCLSITGPARADNQTNDTLEKLVLITETGEHHFNIEIAGTMAAQMKGLMYRRKIPDNYGMLFTHGEPQELTMWMKNTYISLDMIFIRKDGVVHRIESDTEPFSLDVIGSNGPVSAVLEVNAGTAERIGLKAGNKVRHKFFGQ